MHTPLTAGSAIAHLRALCNSRRRLARDDLCRPDTISILAHALHDQGFASRAFPIALSNVCNETGLPRCASKPAAQVQLDIARVRYPAEYKPAIAQVSSAQASFKQAQAAYDRQHAVDQRHAGARPGKDSESRSLAPAGSAAGRRRAPPPGRAGAGTTGAGSVEPVVLRSARAVGRL